MAGWLLWRLVLNMGSQPAPAGFIYKVNCASWTFVCGDGYDGDGGYWERYDDEQEEDRMPATRPLRLRRRAGRSRAYDLAREVVVLAAAETRGFEGGHAAPLTLRGRTREGIAVLLL